MVEVGAHLSTVRTKPPGKWKDTEEAKERPLRKQKGTGCRTQHRLSSARRRGPAGPALDRSVRTAVRR